MGGELPTEQMQAERTTLVRPSIATSDEIGPDGKNIFDPGEDPKGWDRASIKLRTHPLHPMPKLTPADILLPYRRDKLRLAADCALIGIAFGILAYFPLLMVALAVTISISNWIWGTMGAVAVLTAAYAFRRSWSPELRELDRF
jgi:hypothetical protein